MKTRKGLLVIIILLALGWNNFPVNTAREYLAEKFSQGTAEIVLTPEARTHILHGDDHGGGHMFGIGKPCKSEFPQGWNADKIITVVEKVAANDNLNWMQQINGYYIAEEQVEDVEVRVVLDRDKENVITAYPVNLGRNPCPSPANDNQSQ